MLFIKKKSPLIIALLLLFVSSSCVVSKQQIGSFDASKCKTTETIKGKDFYLFWNQIKVKKISDDVKQKNYEIVIKRNVFDTFVFYGSIGIFSFYTVKIKTCKETTKS